MRIAVLPLALALMLASSPVMAGAVPEADHVRIECIALRLKVNDFSIRHQIKLLVTVTSSDEERLSGVDLALLGLASPGGEEVTMACRECRITPRQFKAANARLLFMAVEDSAAPLPSPQSNVPAGFFTGSGPYQVSLTLRGELFKGEVSFGDQLEMAVDQAGRPAQNFCLADELPLAISTEPAEFGPVYYKRQDLTSFVYQLASMNEALQGKDYHPQRESPQYVFQIRVGDSEGGPAALVDPARYIEGHKRHLIRSDQTSTPLSFSAEEFKPGDVVIVDFMRQETLDPDAGFEARDNFSAQVVVQDRVVYALSVETAPTPEELGQVAE
jgi:hypothetical protein